MPDTTKIFSYCERGTDPAFWAEPINAVTNAAFLVAALLTLKDYVALPRTEMRWDQPVLIALVFTIGIGSFLFHTFAEPWSAAADVLPIVLFIYVYLYMALTHFMQLARWQTALILIAFIAVSGAMSMARCSDAMILLDVTGDARPPCLNGSAAYLPPLAAMLVIGSILRARDHAAAKLLLFAGATFALSVTFRTIDQAGCDLTVFGGREIGTHFLWHILNAITLYLLLKAAIINPTTVQN